MMFSRRAFLVSLASVPILLRWVHRDRVAGYIDESRNPPGYFISPDSRGDNYHEVSRAEYITASPSE